MSKFSSFSLCFLNFSTSDIKLIEGAKSSVERNRSLLFDRRFVCWWNKVINGISLPWGRIFFCYHTLQLVLLSYIFMHQWYYLPSGLFQFNYGEIGQMLFDIGKRPEVKSDRRKRLYKVSKKWAFPCFLICFFFHLSLFLSSFPLLSSSTAAFYFVINISFFSVLWREIWCVFAMIAI